jgi:hypothetical protein
VGERVNVDVFVTVGLGVGLGKTVMVGVNVRATCDWQAARKMSSKLDKRSPKSGDFGLRWEFILGL